MQLIQSVEEFLEAPVGCYIAGPNYIYWCIDPGFYGFSAWGSPEEAQAKRLVSAWQANLAPRATVPQKAFVDLRGLESVDKRVYQRLAEYFEPAIIKGRSRITHQALVRPSELAGAIVQGFFNMVPAPYAVQVFQEPLPALAWLGREDPDADAELLERLRHAAASESMLLASLHAALVRQIAVVTLGKAAATLGLSERTLQRRLTAAGTTFQAELDVARVRLAQTLLRQDHAKLAAIALEVGCGSSQHFSTLFRRITGLPPSVWRAQALQRERAPKADPPPDPDAKRPPPISRRK